MCRLENNCVKRNSGTCETVSLFLAFAVQDFSRYFEGCDFLYSAGLMPTYFLNFLWK